MKSLHFFTFAALVGMLLGVLASCDTNAIIDQNTDLGNKQWSYDQKPSFEANITDTSQQYNMYINVRHTDDYPYSNMWVVVRTTLPNQPTQTQRVELPLADKQGKWYGTGMGDVITQQVMIQPNAVFRAAGKCRFELEQDMRLNPLPNVLSVGMRIERATNQKPVAKQPKPH